FIGAWLAHDMSVGLEGRDGTGLISIEEVKMHWCAGIVRGMDSPPDPPPMPAPPDPPDPGVPPVEPVRMPPAMVDMPATAEDQHCLQCGYALRGQSTAGMCPECGTPVARSMHGDLLRYSQSEYVRLLRIGTMMVIIGVIAEVVHRLTSAPLVKILSSTVPVLQSQRGMLESVANLAGVAIAVLIALGWWLLSSPDPALHHKDTNVNARRVVRIFVIIIVVILMVRTMFEFGVMRPPSYASAGLTVLSVVMRGVSFFPAMLYLEKLARRLPSKKLADRTRLYLWLLPVIHIVGYPACFLGPVVTTTLYCIFLGTVYRLLTKTLELQRAAGFMPATD
ncbi:MAG: hypothetical protein KC983_03610, partial [Phycisphaerales bacterium]|nr:hypothetical protein [Phycisphaerales bacterium]